MDGQALRRQMQPVSNGVDAVCANPELLDAGAIGLFTNFTGTTQTLGRTVDALLEAGLPVRALFGPEHGLRGSVQAGETETSATDETTGLPIYETYGAAADRIAEMIVESGIDTLVFDMQDIGVRYYTYVWSMFDGLSAAAQAGVPMVVLDRPNPLGGLVAQGPGVAARFESFVGRTDVPLRHGLTIGELAHLFQARLAAVGRVARLTVVPMRGWRRGDFRTTGLPWVPPSPNMPTLESGYAFGAYGLLEGTNISEGRGTTKPFELFGAPYFDSHLIPALRQAAPPGVLFREAWFTPVFSKYAGQALRGIQLHIVDPAAYDPLLTGLTTLAVISRLYGDRLTALPPYEGSGRRPLDVLWGDARLGDAIDAGRVAVDDFYTPPQAVTDGPFAPYLLYPPTTKEPLP